MNIDHRYIQDRGEAVFNGNELLVKGALETEGGVHLLTGYPGSPVATFFDALAELGPLLREKGMEATIANNEALSVAAVNGSQMGPLRAIVVFKNVGAHVASDALALGNLAGAHPEGGVVVVLGDDPWTESSQVPADSRFLSEHHRMPVLEPGTPQEIKDWVDIGFKLSQASGLYVGYLITPALADGGGSVQCRPNHYPLTSRNHPVELDTSALDLERTVLLPPRTGRNEEAMHLRYGALHEAARRLGVDRVEHGEADSPVAIITSSMAYQYVVQTLTDLELSGSIPILKLGVTYPLDEDQIVEFTSRYEHVVIVEERRSFIERQVATILMQQGQRGRGHVPKVWGKTFPGSLPAIPDVRGLNPTIVMDRLARLLVELDLVPGPAVRKAIESQLALAADLAHVEGEIPPRTPTFCPGCPHRDSSNVLLQIKRQFADPRYMRKHHRRSAVDLVFHGDTGCYTMLMFPPNSDLMHNYSGMGLGGGTGSGVDPFITNKQVVFMGDSTFFHSGQLAISNSVTQNQDITYIILDNGTTAMTGHQVVASNPTDLLGRSSPAINIDQIVKAATAQTGCTVVRVDPSDRKRYKRLLEQVILSDGVKVLIADKECGITRQRKVRSVERAEEQKTGFLRKKTHMNITPEVCDYCLECTINTGCPGLTTVETDHGPKMATDLSWCVNDGACANLQACPSFEEVTITRRRPPVVPGSRMRLDDLPEPTSRATFDGDIWRAWLSGVGGMGIGVAGSVLVRAGEAEGYRLLFADKKGLAIRNGGVYAQVIFLRNDAQAVQVIPSGQADLLLGVDIVEAARVVEAKVAYRVARPDKTAAVLNLDRTPTILGLIHGETFDVDALCGLLRSRTRKDAFFAQRMSYQCERLFGTKQYTNISMLGVAWQMGLIPVSLDSMKSGITETVRQTDFKKNMRAFNLGRKLVTHPELFAETKPPRTLARIVREKTTYLNMRRFGTRRALTPARTRHAAKLRLPDSKLARRYKHLVYTTLRACRELDRTTMRDIAVWIYDLIQWGGVGYAKTYVTQIRRTFLADSAEHGFAATRAVAWNLAKLMLIKDEFYVAHLLTSIEKLRRDRQRYNVNLANGDRLRYRRTFHPRLFGKAVSIRIPNWTLYAMREMRWLRHTLPLFHRADRQFLAWYEGVVGQFGYETEADYRRWVAILNAPDEVTGYREYREPKMASVRQRVEQMLASVGTVKTVSRERV